MGFCSYSGKINESAEISCDASVIESGYFSDFCGMEFPSLTILNYTEAHSEQESELLSALRRETHVNYLYPRMLSGPLQGRLLSMLSKIARPQTILEIGTYTGYSALCLAEGLAPGGKLISLEIDPELRSIAERYVEQAGYSDRIELITGIALEVIPTLDVALDLVFMDAEKYEYPEYYAAVMPKLRSGGLILADNVLWSGQVTDPEIQDKKTEALRQFNLMVSKDRGVEVVMLPIRDGLSVIRKK